MEREAMIEASQLFKRYGDVEAVRGVDLRVEPGQVFGLIGHNGAGKSTLFKMMLGLVPASSGEIRIDGQSVAGPRFREVRRGIGYLPENVAFWDNLTGLETLAFFARLKGAPRGECTPLLERVGLTHAADRRVKGYSKGMRQRLGFAQALLGAPKLLFLDEPTTGLDPEGIREFYAIVRELRAGGATIVLTSHILSEIQERVDRIAVMRTGRIHATGTVQELREAAHLPLRFELQLAGCDAHASLDTALAGLAAHAVPQQGNAVAVHCQREAKMAVLGALSALGTLVTDLRVREPSLEDVFLGYSS
jgi:Cu-processing system ATP-binding protein